jgi:deoxyribodipyrimidine photolyase-related protein
MNSSDAASSAAPILVPILGDQLTRDLASLRGRAKDDTVILMMEVWDEATYVKHHQQKIALIFSAMRHFAAELEEAGWTVDYARLTAPENAGSFTGEVARAVERHNPREIHVVEAGEWRVQQAIEEWPDKFACEVTIHQDDRFLTSIADFRDWAEGRKTLQMEYFYRDMRRKTGILMDEKEPEGGKWNFDHDNRGGPDKDLNPPPAPKFAPDATTSEVLELVASEFSDHFGTLNNFAWPVTRDEAEQARDAFLKERLPDFGTYQDAMVHGSDDLYHSLLSTSLNLGLLDPVETCELAAAEYYAGRAPINAVEGFIRQIIGWREYIRGMYWLEMPGLREANALEATRPLPEFYWTGETDMRCMADCVRSTRENAHSHHIQRLMVLGNFALIAGIQPQEVEDWFLAVYADAYEWVELPNVAGMALWADKGRLATKPYAASGNYISKMSDYCKDCTYSPSKKSGEGACPFGPLYWHFMDRNRPLLSKNNRVSRVYSTWDRMDEGKRADYLDSAEEVLSALVPAKPGWAR